MELVADTNIFLAVALNEPERNGVIELTAGASVIAPEILPYEVGNALSAMVKRQRLTGPEALTAERTIGQIPMRLVPVDVQESLKRALEYDIYAYDAYFLHCAQVFACPLLSLDRRMKEVARHLGVRVLEISS
jgi:predicted nucleic acid-binding protein